MASPEISQLGRYRIIELLGTGNYAAVYKAQDELLGRFVALKVLKDELASDNELLLRFNREARSLANLMHPHIAWVLDVGQIEGKYFLAMRYIEGETLDQVIKDRGKLSWSEALKITDEIGQALDFAHSKSVIHRDIKPKNILVSPKDGAVLTDFGLVKALDDINFRTRTDAIIGTPQYIPPEIWRNEPATPASDQYSLVCVFVEMLEGRPLFDGRGLDVIMRKHLKTPELWDTWSSGVPGDIEDVLRRGLAQQPSDRYPNLKSLISALKRGDEANKTVQQPRPTNIPGTFNIPANTPQQTPSALITPPEMTPPTDQQIRDASLSKSLNAGTSQAKEGIFKRLQKAVQPEREQLILYIRIGKGEFVNLADNEQLYIGRGEGCEIMVDSLGVSRQHARIIIRNGIATIEDLESRNGTFVNGKRIDKPVKLSVGDHISLGKSLIIEVRRVK